MGSMPPALLGILSAQHGVIARHQALGAGLTARQVDVLVRSGRWCRLARSVYGIPGHRESWRRQLWAAVLHAGPAAAVSHESAGRLHGFAEVPAGRVILTVPKDRNTRASSGTWHRSTDLSPEEVVRVDGLPVTSVERTIVDLAAVTHVATMRLLVEHRLVDGTASIAGIGVALDRVRRAGRPGVARLAEVLDRLGDGRNLPRSELERLAKAVVQLSGLPEPLHEAPLPGVGPLEGRVDRCWPAARLILELDGRRWHARSQQMRRDAERTLQAQAAGFDTVRMLWEHCRHDPDGSATTLRRIHDRRMALLRPSPGSGRDR